MAQLPDIIPVRDLRQETAAVLKRVQSSGQPVVITQRGRTAAVMLSLKPTSGASESAKCYDSWYVANRRSARGSDTTWMTYWRRRMRF